MKKVIFGGPFGSIVKYKNCYLSNSGVSCNQMVTSEIRPRGPMDKASDYESGDSRFESWRGHSTFVHFAIITNSQKVKLSTLAMNFLRENLVGHMSVRPSVRPSVLPYAFHDCVTPRNYR